MAWIFPSTTFEIIFGRKYLGKLPHLRSNSHLYWRCEFPHHSDAIWYHKKGGRENLSWVHELLVSCSSERDQIQYLACSDQTISIFYKTRSHVYRFLILFPMICTAPRSPQSTSAACLHITISRKSSIDFVLGLLLDETRGSNNFIAIDGFIERPL